MLAQKGDPRSAYELLANRNRVEIFLNTQAMQISEVEVFLIVVSVQLLKSIVLSLTFLSLFSLLLEYKSGLEMHLPSIVQV